MEHTWALLLLRGSLGLQLHPAAYSQGRSGGQEYDRRVQNWGTFSSGRLGWGCWRAEQLVPPAGILYDTYPLSEDTWHTHQFNFIKVGPGTWPS